MTAPIKHTVQFPAERARATSFNEASARTRIELLLDAGSFVEFIGPAAREVSPHLKIFDIPEQFDDGIVVGRGRLDNSPVFIAAQEGAARREGAQIDPFADPVRYRRCAAAGSQCR
jgi:malonate decarboxylase beta subunit